MTKTPEELTEDWEAGKLPAGWYYLKLENGEIELQNNCIGGFLMSCNNRVIQILASVPSYDEYKAMWDQIADASKKVEELELNNKILEKCQEQDFGVSYLVTVKTQIENNNLRGLLKECKNIVAHDCWQEAQFPDGQVVERQVSGVHCRTCFTSGKNHPPNRGRIRLEGRKP